MKQVTLFSISFCQCLGSFKLLMNLQFVWFRMYLMSRVLPSIRPSLIFPLRSSSGQTAIFIFVLLLVGLTIGISVAGRTFRDLQSSGSSDFSARAFTAAEAGAEEALRQDLSSVTYGSYVNSSSVAPSFGSTNKSTFKYKVDTLAHLSQTVAEDDSVQLSMIKSGGGFFDGSLKIYWGKISDTGSGGENFSGSRPSLEITLLTQSASGEYGYAKFAINAETKSPNNNFALPADISFAVRHSISNLLANYSNLVPNYLTGESDSNPAPNFSGAFTDVLQVNFNGSDRVAYVRVRPLYNKATLGVEAGGIDLSNFPAQSYLVTSQGNSGDATRAVQVTKSLPSLPPIFDFAMFNGSSAQVGK
jgi:hypothetical protein